MSYGISDTVTLLRIKQTAYLSLSFWLVISFAVRRLF